MLDQKMYNHNRHILQHVSMKLHPNLFIVTCSSDYSSVTNSFLHPPPKDATNLPLKCSKTSIAP